VAQAVERVLRSLDTAGSEPTDDDLRLLVRHSLALLSARAPGRSVEVRVPPYAAIQCVPGPRHTRGTPPGVVETDPLTWTRLCLGAVSWHDAVESGKLRASGERTDLSARLPLLPT
jgi:Bacterial SCP ortholog